MSEKIEFQGWPKIGRLNRDIVITEKIDGTNAAIIVHDAGGADDFSRTDPPMHGSFATVEHDGHIYHVAAQSRKRLIYPGQDNFGFALWVATHAQRLVELLGEGRHFGEWFGKGIQSGYSMAHKGFALFNTHRYQDVAEKFEDDTIIGAVPVLYQGPFSQSMITAQIDCLRREGSKAAPGFMKPEGVIVYHSATNTLFKVTLENDESPKGAV